MGEAEDCFRVCLGPALLQYSLSTCYPSSTIMSLYPLQKRVHAEYADNSLEAQIFLDYSKMKIRVSLLQRHALKNPEHARILLQRRTQNCLKHVSSVRGSSQHTKIFILAKLWTSDKSEMTKGLLSNVLTLRCTKGFGCPRSRT